MIGRIVQMKISTLCGLAKFEINHFANETTLETNAKLETQQIYS